jgi:hypothetical protein
MQVVRNVRNAKHRESFSCEYLAWAGLKARCKSGKPKRNRHWAGRGITVCFRWKSSFENFLSDMGRRPSKRHSIDRIDNDKGYWCGKPECPECGPLKREPNCRWATAKQQARNRRSAVNITYDGRTQCLTEWAAELRVTISGLVYRLGKWGVEKALSTPKQENKDTTKRRDGA